MLPIPGWLGGVVPVPGQRVAARGGCAGAGRWLQCGARPGRGWHSSEL